jgi:hypothetical protein
MTARPDSPVQDKNYNLVTVLQQSLHNAWMLEQYVKDAEAQGDEELAKWLHRVQENNEKASEQGKQLLARRLGSEQS